LDLDRQFPDYTSRAPGFRHNSGSPIQALCEKQGAISAGGERGERGAGPQFVKLASVRRNQRAVTQDIAVEKHEAAIIPGKAQTARIERRGLGDLPRFSGTE